MLKPVIRSLVKQAVVSTSYCNYRWGSVINPKRALFELSTHLSRHMTSKTTTMSSNTINVQYKKEELMELEPEEANKSLYFWNVEYKRPAYTILSVKLSNLFSSSSSPVPLRQLFRYAHPHLPVAVGCGLFGSEIFVVGGITRNCPTGSCWKRDVYMFDTYTNDPNESISKLNTKMQGGKMLALTTELCGKLYVLSNKMVDDSPPFEVFDPKLGTWEALLPPPFAKTCSYAVTDTKIFVSSKECPVLCFDAANPGKEWRMVSTMGSDPFQFDKRALVLDLDDEDDNKKIMFAYTEDPWRLQVYVMSLLDNHETITRIGDVEIPELPEDLGWTSGVEFIHIGGKKVSLVVTVISDYGCEDDYFLKNGDKSYGVVIPFQYELDMTKGERYNLTLQFMPIRCFEHHTNSSISCTIDSVNCFLL